MTASEESSPPDAVAGPAEGAEHAPSLSRHPGHAPEFPIRLKFLKEVRRRNVVRVAILYVVACWVILEPTHLVFFMLEVPVWANRLVIILMVVGFPLVLLFSWVYEITPDGIKPTVEVDRRHSITHQTGQRLNRAIIAGLSAAVVVLLVDKFWPTRYRVAETAASAAAPAPTAAAASAGAPATQVADRSIAVLPFVDMSERHDQEYFSDGLAEQLLDVLSRVPDLRVAARTSAFSFKGKSDDIPTIARKLLVANVLEGSVRKSGKTLRITAQLVRAENGYHLWSQTFDRKLDDIFKIQDEIANAVVQALKISVFGTPTSTVAGTGNTAAYNLYLQGVAESRRASSVADYAKSERYFRDAIRLDSGYALAWASMSTALSGQAELAAHFDQRFLDEARRAAHRALEIDPGLADAHVAVARISILQDLDLAEGEREIRRALEIDPRNQWALAWKATLAAFRGDDAGAIESINQALASDPVNPNRYSDLASFHYLAGRYREAIDTARHAADLRSTEAGLHGFIAAIRLREGDPALALREFDQETDEVIKSSSALRVRILDALGRKGEADALLMRLEKEFGNDNAVDIAMTYARRGDGNLAFQWLDRAFKQRDAGLTSIRVEPEWQPIRGDPRFDVLLRRLKFS